MDEVEGLTWHRSTDCESTACVEVAAAEGWVYLRDGKQPDGDRLRLSSEAWTRLRQGIKRGDFDII